MLHISNTTWCWIRMYKDGILHIVLFDFGYTYNVVLLVELLCHWCRESVIFVREILRFRLDSIKMLWSTRQALQSTHYTGMSTLHRTGAEWHNSTREHRRHILDTFTVVLLASTDVKYIFGIRTFGVSCDISYESVVIGIFIDLYFSHFTSFWLLKYLYYLTTLDSNIELIGLHFCAIINSSSKD